MPQPTQTVSQVIAQLTAVLHEYGDVSVWINDADTGWPLSIDSVEYSRGDSAANEWAGVYISGSYE